MSYDLWGLIVDGINNGNKPANYDSSNQPYYTGTPEGVNASRAFRAYPNNFLYSGYSGGLSISGRGSFGRYWSSTSYNAEESCSIHLHGSAISPGRTIISGITASVLGV